MQKVLQHTVLFSLSFIGLLATLMYFISDPSPDFVLPEPTFDSAIALHEIETTNTYTGHLKTSVEFTLAPSPNNNKAFYGQAFHFDDNTSLDYILIGITNNLIARAEVWLGGQRVEAKELGFMDKMTWGDTQQLVVEFHDQRSSKYPEKSKIHLRFLENEGFFGDIATISLDLSKYGDLSGLHDISVFAKALSGELLEQPTFSNLKVWRQFRTFD